MTTTINTFDYQRIVEVMRTLKREHRAWFDEAGPTVFCRPSGLRFTSAMVGRDKTGTSPADTLESQTSRGNFWLGRRLGSFFCEQLDLQQECREAGLKAGLVDRCNGDPVEASYCGASLSFLNWDHLRMVDPAWPDQEPSITWILRPGFAEAYRQVEAED